MLTRRTLELRADAATLGEPHLPSDVLVDCGYATTMLARAETKAALLLADTEEACARRLAKAQEDFWCQAQAVLDAWQAQRAAETVALEAVALELVNAALAELLSEVPPPARLQALLRQLQRSQHPPVPGQLCCAPDVEAAVRAWCAQRPDLPWQPQPDPTLPSGQLLLRTEDGDFCLDWARASHSLRFTPEPISEAMEPPA